MNERGLWDEDDGFYYDRVRRPDGTRRAGAGAVDGRAASRSGRRRDRQARRCVGRLAGASSSGSIGFAARAARLRAGACACASDGAAPPMLALVGAEPAAAHPRHLADPDEFLSPYGLRSLSAEHREHPYDLSDGGHRTLVDYEPGGVDHRPVRRQLQLARTDLVPAELPRDRGAAALQPASSATTSPSSSPPARAAAHAGRDRRRPVPSGSSRSSSRATGRPPARASAAAERFQRRPALAGRRSLFYEYFHGDNGAGLGASHQTGWTALVADLMIRLLRCGTAAGMSHHLGAHATPTRRGLRGVQQRRGRRRPVPLRRRRQRGAAPARAGGGHVWTGRVEGAATAGVTATASTARRPATRRSCSLDPVRARHRRARCTLGPRTSRAHDDRDSAPFVPALGRPERTVRLGRRPAARDAAGRLGHVRAAREGLHEAAPRRPRGATRHVRRPRPTPRRSSTSLDLGVTAVELLPVHTFVRPGAWPARAAQLLGLRHDRLLRPARRLRRAGRGRCRVPRDGRPRCTRRASRSSSTSCFNHTAEGGARRPDAVLPRPGRRRPTTGWTATAHYVDITGCGNTLDAGRPTVLRLVMDALRYWVDRDARRRVPLRPRQRRSGRAARRPFDPHAALLDRRSPHDPVLSPVKLIAEPWDATGEGYRVGGFGGGWSEWNGRYRDAVRDFWRGHGRHSASCASRLTGSSDLYGAAVGGRWASINFVTAHDGFTLATSSSYDAQAQRGQRRGQPRRHRRQPLAGTAASRGRPTIPGVLALRAPAARATARHAAAVPGVPMLLGGDELGAPRAATTTPTARTTRRPGSTGTRRGPRPASRTSRPASAACGASAGTPPARIPARRPLDPGRHRRPRLAAPRRQGHGGRGLGRALCPRRDGPPRRRRGRARHPPGHAARPVHQRLVGGPALPNPPAAGHGVDRRAGHRRSRRRAARGGRGRRGHGARPLGRRRLGRGPACMSRVRPTWAGRVFFLW